MAEKELLLMGGAGRVFQEDANEGFGNSPESGVSMRIRTKRHVVEAPAGEAVGKRLFISAEHNRGISFEAIPVGDGAARFPMRQFFSRPASPGEARRESFLIPLQEERENGLFTSGLRATTFGLVLRADMPEGGFNLESIQFEFIRLQGSRGRAEQE